MLPCNVIVYEDNKNVFVSIILPTAGMSMVENPVLADIAKEVAIKNTKDNTQLNESNDKPMTKEDLIINLVDCYKE